MGWLVDLIKPMVARVWQAFRGFGHTMDAHVCTNPHVFVAIGPTVVSPSQVSPHLHVDFQISNTGGRDVTIVTWEMPEPTGTYTATGYPTGDLVLEKSGKVVTAPYRANVVGGAAANPRGERRGD